MDPSSSDLSYGDVESGVFPIFCESLFDSLPFAAVGLLNECTSIEVLFFLCDSSPDRSNESVN